MSNSTMRFFDPLQAIGRALMLPIAVLPIAGLMLRFGQPDLLNIGWLAQAGQAVFSALPLLFAIGVAVGLARENHGVAGLAGTIGYLVLTAVMKQINADLDMGVLAGILCGSVAGVAYNRCSDIKLPEYLAFFGGKRFVPIVTGVVCLVLALILGHVWAPVQTLINRTGQWLLGAGAFGVFVYGLLNRLLLVAGLHHILNSLVWFVFGSYQGADGAVVTGDLHRFFAGDPHAGAFMTGFFPIMMFALPAACFAMIHAAPPERRAKISGLLLSMALTSFLTGVTEPIEFTFMFLAPPLFLLHAVLTGLSGALMYVLHVRLGFTFSAGAIDYLLSYGLASRPLLLLPVGIAFGAIYYAAFRFAIVKFNLATPGREPEADDADDVVADGERAVAFIAALGGAGNLRSVDACTTRLRLRVADSALANEAALKALGARGVLRPAKENLQVVLGPQAEIVAGEIRRAWTPGAVPAATTAKPAPVAAAAVLPTAWLKAVGGAANLIEGRLVAGSRLRLRVANEALLDEAALKALGVLARTPTQEGCCHLLLTPGTQLG